MEDERINTIPEEEMEEAEDVKDIVLEVVNREYLTALRQRGVPFDAELKKIKNERFGIFHPFKSAKLTSECIYELKKELMGLQRILHATEPNTPAYTQMLEDIKLMSDALATLDKSASDKFLKGLAIAGSIVGPILGGATLYFLDQKFGEIPGHSDAKKQFFNSGKGLFGK